MLKHLFLYLIISVISFSAFSQGAPEDYKRSEFVKRRLAQGVDNDVIQINWSEKGDVFWYEKNGQGRRELFIVDPVARTKGDLFPLNDLQNALFVELKSNIDPYFFQKGLPKLVDRDTVKFQYDGFHWKWDRSNKVLTKLDSVDQKPMGYWGHRIDESKGNPVESPDKSKIAYLKDFNIYIADKGKEDSEQQITKDGTEDFFYSSMILWSPDGKKISSSKVQKAKVRKLTLIESSPIDQLQPKVHTKDYIKPGDTLSQYFPMVYNLEIKKLWTVDKAMVDNQFALYALDWRQDSHAVSFEYNKRGHQQYSIMELNANTGKTRTVLNETSKTFIDYSGKKFRYDLNDGKEIIWASERDGWNHLYLIDGNNGEVKKQLTKGDWVVRRVLKVDEQQKKIFFTASGMYKDEDPYFIHYYSMNLDGTNLKDLSPELANHEGTFSRDYSYFVDRYSKIDQVPVTVLRNSAGEVVMDIERSNLNKFSDIGWKPAEVFTSKARDGKTDIWGIIIRPTNFDPNKKYPVIEYIYAGPHSSFVPKSFYANPSGMQDLAELGFIVVQIDGMGTSNRSKAFHDVAWKNLKDAGFPDRILWMKAAAAKYPYMDLDRVGIYGTSAGGQSAAGALLFHPEFYKVGVASCGCHDNRMDKIWWNEQWMGWPIEKHYEECSNVVNANRLKGKLMLIVGELDDNVDPASTYQFSNALIKANKDHELVVIPGMGHSSGGEYGEKKRRDFFVKHLYP